MNTLCLHYVNYTPDFSTLSYSELTRTYKLRNNKYNFFSVRVWIRVQKILHCVQSVQIRSFFWSLFGHFSRIINNNIYKQAKYSAFAVNSCSRLVIKVLVKKYNICSKSTLMTRKRYIPCEENYLQCYFIVNYSYVILAFLMVILVLWSFEWRKKFKGIATDD